MCRFIYRELKIHFKLSASLNTSNNQLIQRLDDFTVSAVISIDDDLWSAEIESKSYEIFCH